MADISSAQVSVGTTATLLVTADTDGCQLYLHNKGGTVTYLGSDAVTSSTGMGIDSGAGVVHITLPANAKLYAITASGTQTVQILKVGND